MVKELVCAWLQRSRKFTLRWSRGSLLPKVARKFKAVKARATQPQNVLTQLNASAVQTFQQATRNRSKCWHDFRLKEKKKLTQKPFQGRRRAKRQSSCFMQFLYIELIFARSQKRILIYCKFTHPIKTTFWGDRTFRYLCATSNNLSLFCPRAQTVLKCCTVQKLSEKVHLSANTFFFNTENVSFETLNLYAFCIIKVQWNTLKNPNSFLPRSRLLCNLYKQQSLQWNFALSS